MTLFPIRKKMFPVQLVRELYNVVFIKLGAIRKTSGKNLLPKNCNYSPSTQIVLFDKALLVTAAKTDTLQNPPHEVLQTPTLWRLLSRPVNKGELSPLEKDCMHNCCFRICYRCKIPPLPEISAPWCPKLVTDLVLSFIKEDKTKTHYINTTSFELQYWGKWRPLYILYAELENCKCAGVSHSHGNMYSCTLSISRLLLFAIMSLPAAMNCSDFKYIYRLPWKVELAKNEIFSLVKVNVGHTRQIANSARPFHEAAITKHLVYYLVVIRTGWITIQT